MEEKLEDWNIEIINGLMSVKGIESEQFDFKKDIHTTDKSDKFSNHICAMANSSGGYIVVGIEEKKAPNGTVLGFTKYGFRQGDQDKITQTISNHVFGVDPLPKVRIKNIVEGNKFYPALKIETEESKKPFFTNRGQCYIMVGNTSKAASRGFILNLLQRHVVTREELHNHTKYLKEIFEMISAISIFDDRYMMKRLQVPDNYKNYRINLAFGLFDSKVRQEHPYEYIEIENVSHVDWALSHLESEEYQSIHDQFAVIEESVKTYNKSIYSMHKIIQKQLKALLSKQFPGFRPRLDSDNREHNSYDIEKSSLYLIRKLITSKLYNVDLNDTELKIEHSPHDNLYFIETQGIGLLMQSNNQDILSLDKLNSIFNTICGNKVLNKHVNLIIKKEKHFDKMRTEFRKSIEKLVIDFNGGEVIKVYCKLGY